MLPGKRYTFANTCCDKYFSKAMEIGKGLSKASNVLGRDRVSTDDITTQNERGETLDNVFEDMAMDCCDVDL
jgi:hypothetical protein